jgi:hypothetical protein
LNNTADIFTKNTTEKIFQTHAVKFVKPIPNKAEMCHFNSANYEDSVLDNEQNDWIVIAQLEQKSKQTKNLAIAKQEGKLNLPPYELKRPLNMPMHQMKY